MIRFLGSNKIYARLMAVVVVGFLTSFCKANAADPQLATGNTHSCIVTAEKTVECWGDNSYGKLGRTSNSKLKEAVPGITNVKSVVVGDNHTCVLLEDGTVKCWGANTEGQLGKPSAPSGPTPVTVTTYARELVAGAAHNCAATGSVVQCWGRNSSGQLGVGFMSPFIGSLAVVMANDRGPLFSLSNLVAGANHTCATLNWNLYCWGAGGSGQLGGYSNTNSAYPVTSVNGYAGDIMSAGATHTCAAWLGDYEVYCWGNWGGTTSTSPQMISVYTGNNSESVASIDSGNNHVCVTLVGGSVRCFGQNLDAQVGNGTTNTYVAAPTAVVGINSPVLKVSAGGSSSCALLANGSIACWGLNGWGQLGDSTQRRAVSAVSAGWWKSITSASGVTAVGVGYSHTCALKNNQVKCWGNNINGQVGNAVAIGAIQKAPVVVGGLTGNIVSLVSGNLHNCVLIDDGSVKCWGGNTEGQLGDGNIASAQALPVSVVGLNQAATSIMAAGDFTCAALADKTVKCWGSNSHGQLGAGLTIASSATPLTVYDLFNVTALSGKMVHACALLDDKSTKCWGANYTGQLGDGTTTNSNVPVANYTWIKDAIKISAGTNNTCILRQGNLMWCWGAVTGNGTSTVNTRPIDVASLFNVTDISAGDFSACAVISNGTVKCFGSDTAVLGDGTATPSSGNSYFPNSVRWLAAPATSIVHGRNGSACAILTTGQLSCWGYNGFGQLGDGTSVTRNEPVLVNL